MEKKVIYSERLYNTIILIIAVSVIFLHLKYASQPLLDLHSFRQTQTAITSYWMDFHDLGKSLFSYETPVLGYPWSIPFEFPLFQIVTAGVHFVTGLSLDISGRLLSSFLYFLCFIPLFKIIKDLGFNKEYFYISAILLLFSPLYFYWSRAFLMESTALLSGLLFLWTSIRYNKTCHIRWIFGMLLFGVLCALIKITTFPSFVIAAFFSIIALDKVDCSVARIKSCFLKVIPLFLVLIVCFILLKLWTQHADHLKESTDISSFLTSKSLQTWNFGTLSQRISFQFWKVTLLDRIIPHAIGSPFVLFVIIAGFFTATKKQKWILCALLILFFAPLFLFTNLHIVHDYYQYANSIWLVLCLAYSLYIIRLKYQHQYYFYLLLLVIVCFCDAYQINRHYLKHMRDINASQNDQSNEDRLAVASKIRSATPSNSMIIVLGEGWGSEIPYYSERKAVMVIDWMSTDQAIKMLKNDQIYGGLPVSGIIVNKKDLSQRNNELIPILLSSHKGLDVLTEIGNFDLYTAHTNLVP